MNGSAGQSIHKACCLWCGEKCSFSILCHIICTVLPLNNPFAGFTRGSHTGSCFQRGKESWKVSGDFSWSPHPPIAFKLQQIGILSYVFQKTMSTLVQLCAPWAERSVHQPSFQSWVPSCFTSTGKLQCTQRCRYIKHNTLEAGSVVGEGSVHY